MISANPLPLSASFKGTFAYKTVKDRLPVILTKVIDTVCRQKHEALAAHGSEASDELKNIIHQCSELRYRMATDKPLTELESPLHDTALWNAYFKDYVTRHNQEPSWYKSSWLYVECFMYRRIAAAFQTSRYFCKWDPFRYQKEQTFIESLSQMEILGGYLEKLLLEQQDNNSVEQGFVDWILLSSWGNKCDLSITSNGALSDPLLALRAYNDYILVNDISDVFKVPRVLNAFIYWIWTHFVGWKYLSSDAPSSSRRIDLILDNAGFELFGDLCLAEFLLKSQLASVVHLHVKAMPWFVSDTTAPDFSWTLELLRGSDRKCLSDLGHRWHARLEAGEFVVRVHEFWTLPHSYDQMRAVASDLYDDLAKSRLLIFKGDLNYRKLVGDLNWDPLTSFETALRGFAPAPLVSLRTLKADVVVGLGETVAAKLDFSGDKEWMTTGDYCVIQFLNNPK